MKKLFSFVAATLMSASLFAAPAAVPTVQDVATAGYDLTKRVIVLYFDEEVCNDVVWAGSYNEWNTGTPSEMITFEALEGFDGWYVIELDDASATVQGKPVQLKKDGSFSWDYQSGDVDAWENMSQPGTQTATFEAGYDDEADCTWPELGVYIYELAYFKQHKTPCFDNISYIINHKNMTAEVNAIDNCVSSIILPMSITYDQKKYDVTTIRDYAFRGCSRLTSIDIPNSVTTIGSSTFSNCGSLSSITIPNSITTIGEYAFGYCTGLTSVTIGNSVTTIGSSAFYGCSGLKKTNYTGTIADWCKIKFENGGSNPMYYSHNFYINDVEIKDLVIPEGVDTIGNYAFYYCRGLTSITIPNSVTTIENRAFYSCSGLTSITNYATTPPTCGSDCDCFDGVIKTIPVYVPARSVDAYKKALYWGGFTNIQGNPNDYAIVTCSATNGTIKGGGKYIKGDTCTLTVTPNYGYHFTQWSDGNTENPRSFVVTQDTTFFSAQLDKNQYLISVEAEHGEANGSGYYEYLSSAQISVTADEHYHFVKWSDGNTSNPRTISVTGNKTYTAIFAIDQHSVSAIANYGNVSGIGICDYGKEITLTVIPDFGYNFIGWNDGNTDNPRSLVVTQDTTFTAQFEQQSTIMGRCGNDLVWTLHNGVLNITGSGDMYDSNYDSWSRWADQITTINLPTGLTHIGEDAFANCVNVSRIDLPASVTSIGCGAFYNDYSIEEITSPTSAVPIVDCDETFYKVSQYVYVYVISDLVRKYQINQYWQKFDIRVLGAEEQSVTKDEVTVTPQEDQATLVWPADDQAAGYSIEITKDGVVFCTLKFNAQGQLIGIAFAPSRGGELRTMQEAEMTASGWQFTVTGLTPGSKYVYTVDVVNAQQQSIKQYTGEFTTTGGISTDWNQLTDSPVHRFTKIIKDNHLLIFHNGKTYNALGSRVK